MREDQRNLVDQGDRSQPSRQLPDTVGQNGSDPNGKKSGHGRNPQGKKERGEKRFAPRKFCIGIQHPALIGKWRKTRRRTGRGSGTHHRRTAPDRAAAGG
jgi:hypothetical protein